MNRESLRTRAMHALDSVRVRGARTEDAPAVSIAPAARLVLENWLAGRYMHPDDVASACVQVERAVDQYDAPDDRAQQVDAFGWTTPQRQARATSLPGQMELL